MTGKRRLILDVLDQAHDHPSAEDVYNRVIARDPHVSIATVYRTIDALTEAGGAGACEAGGGQGSL